MLILVAYTVINNIEFYAILKFLFTYFLAVFMVANDVL